MHRYQNGQFYESHYDHVYPEYQGPRPWTRTVSVLLYLSDVESGGETAFPLEGSSLGEHGGQVFFPVA